MDNIKENWFIKALYLSCEERSVGCCLHAMQAVAMYRLSQSMLEEIKGSDDRDYQFDCARVYVRYLKEFMLSAFRSEAADNFESYIEEASQ